MTVPEAAELLRCSPRTIHRRVKDGTIPHRLVAGRILMRRRDLEGPQTCRGVRSYWAGHAYIRTDATFASIDADPPDGAGQEACVACLLARVQAHLGGGAS